jgi:hypothetical protein
MESRDEMIDTVAQRIGRKRIHLPVREYGLDDARLQNAFGWPGDDDPSQLILDDQALLEAWDRSERLIRAWA